MKDLSGSGRGAEATRAILLSTRGLRAFGDGLLSLSVPAYLSVLGFSALEIGVVVTATQAGASALTLAVGFLARRFRVGPLLIAAAALMLISGLGLTWLQSFLPILLLALFGAINPTTGDIGMAAPLEHATLAQSVEGRGRTALFARYSLVGSLAMAFGGLAAAAPQWIAQGFAVSLETALRGTFLVYALVASTMIMLYRRLPAEAPPPVVRRPGLGRSRRTVFGLSALFALDAFGGGFVVQSLLALWLFERFGVSLATAAMIFFWAGLASSLSFLFAAPIARRIGLVNTMIFTHLPANICLCLVPLAPNLSIAVGLLLTRSLLAQMDVPTRISYVMAIVEPHERAAAAGVTTVVRSLAGSISPMFAGSLLAVSPFGWPLMVGGILKIVYDILLMLMFSRVRAPEERDASET